MRMGQRRVAVPMRVRFAGGIERLVWVLMVCVVYVLMFVIHHVMSVGVLMRFLEMQVNTHGHQ